MDVNPKIGGFDPGVSPSTLGFHLDFSRVYLMIHMVVSKHRGIFSPPKWMVNKFHGKPYWRNGMIWGEFSHYFWVDTQIQEIWGEIWSIFFGGVVDRVDLSIKSSRFLPWPTFHGPPKKTWVSIIALSCFSWTGVRWDTVPFNFWWIKRIFRVRKSDSQLWQGKTLISFLLVTMSRDVKGTNPSSNWGILSILFSSQMGGVEVICASLKSHWFPKKWSSTKQ